MGIMYKLLRHKQPLGRLELAAAGSMQEAAPRRRTITLEGNIEEEQQLLLDAAEPLAVEGVDKFTAEHIIQLCRFLAEKSIRNKIAQSQYHRISEFPRLTEPTMSSKMLEPATVEHEAEEEAEEIGAEDAYTTALLPQSGMPPSEDRAATTRVLKDKLTAADSKGNTTSSSEAVVSTSYTNNFTARQVCNQQSKRDVLLKIRQQILERKRQRQLVHVQQRMGVWRPW